MGILINKMLFSHKIIFSFLKFIWSLHSLKECLSIDTSRLYHWFFHYGIFRNYERHPIQTQSTKCCIQRYAPIIFGVAFWFHSHYTAPTPFISWFMCLLTYVQSIHRPNWVQSDKHHAPCFRLELFLFPHNTRSFAPPNHLISSGKSCCCVVCLPRNLCKTNFFCRMTTCHDPTKPFNPNTSTTTIQPYPQTF